jgi:hypothetical protein
MGEMAFDGFRSVRTKKSKKSHFCFIFTPHQSFIQAIIVCGASDIKSHIPIQPEDAVLAEGVKG